VCKASHKQEGEFFFCDGRTPRRAKREQQKRGVVSNVAQGVPCVQNNERWLQPGSCSVAVWILDE